MTFAPMYPVKAYDCDICGGIHAGDMECPRLDDEIEALREGSLFAPAEYLPLWHYRTFSEVDV